MASSSASTSSRNGGLVVYCHGYSNTPGICENKPNPFIDIFTSQGYAFIQSGYAAGGWAIQEAVADTEAAPVLHPQVRRARESFITGHSMGGFLTMMMVELFRSVTMVDCRGPSAPPRGSWSASLS